MGKTQVGGLTVEFWIYCIALAIIAAVSLAALYHPKFFDNILQRLGLVLTCFGASLRLYTVLQGDDLPGLRYLLTIGIAVYAIGTAQKFWKFNRGPAP